MKLLMGALALLFVNTQAFAGAVDVICDCKGVVIYAGLGQVGGTGANVDEAMRSAADQCAGYRGGDRIEKCAISPAKENPSVVCGCRTGIFHRGQVSGSGVNLSEAFKRAIEQCEYKGLSIEVLNGLNSCLAY